MTTFTSLLDLGMSLAWSPKSSSLLLSEAHLLELASFCLDPRTLTTLSHDLRHFCHFCWMADNELSKMNSIPCSLSYYLCLPFFSMLSTQAIGFIIFLVYSSLCSVYP